MAYPSTLTSFTDPLATDRLNSPSHSSIESAQNTGLEEIQAYIGINTGVNASAVGTLLYDIKAPNSDGGGHVQTATKGGTGQTTYTKGDLLVAQNSSTLAKLAVGNDTQILQLNTSTASGMNWANVTNNRLTSSASIIGIANTETSVLSVTLPGSVLSTANTIRTTAHISDWTTRTGMSVLAIANYGGTVSSVVVTPQGGDTIGIGTIRHTMIGNNSASSQRHFLEFEGALRQSGGAAGYFTSPTINPDAPFNPSVATVFRAFANTISSINSSANQTLGLTIRIMGANSSASVSGVIVEKIV